MGFKLFSKSGRKILSVLPASLAASQLLAASPEDQGKLVAANTAFAFDLMNRVAGAQPNGNVFISPFSVSSVLQMVENGAAGQTKAEMQQALKTSGLSAESLNAAFRDLNQQFTGRKDVVLNLANGLWFQTSFHLKPAFVDDNQKFFQAELTGVDFGDPQSANIINDWANKQTQGKINEVVQFPFDPLTRLILANAIYFKGKWEKPFEKSATQPRPFHLANGQSQQAPMMVQGGEFAYQENADFQAVKLPYNGGLQMELYLPGTNSTPQMFLDDMAGNQKRRDVIRAGFSQREGSVTLSKSKIEYEIVLNGPLQTLGMKSAFAGNADFSGIADEAVFISQVKQNSFVDVNEEGTEAAAVTALTMRAMAMQMPSLDRFTMILDRPFFFVISDVSTGSILFLGVVNDPVGR
jgi:serine protease inhibitor